MKVHVLMDMETKKPLAAARRREVATEYAAQLNRPISIEEIQMIEGVPNVQPATPGP